MATNANVRFAPQADKPWSANDHLMQPCRNQNAMHIEMLVPHDDPKRE
jgi:hypothetical protein